MNNENELQKAIDDIARANGQGAPVADNAVSSVGQTVAPVIEKFGSVSEAPQAETGGAMPAAENVAPVVDTPAAEEEPKETPKEMSTEDVRERALEDLKLMIGTVDLAPILGKADLTPETKFKIYKSIIETTRDKGVLGAAYETAKAMTSDDARAEALLYIVEMADKL